MMRKMLPVYIIVDSSVFMRRGKLQSAREFLEEWIAELKELVEDQSNFTVGVFVMCYSNLAYFKMDEPIDISDFEWPYDDHAYGAASFGHMMSVFNKKLSEGEYRANPLIVLVSGSTPTDEYCYDMCDLWKNSKFKKAYKVAIAIGDDADLIALEEFTGDKDIVMRGLTMSSFRRITYNIFKEMMGSIGVHDTEIFDIPEDNVLSWLDTEEDDTGLCW